MAYLVGYPTPQDYGATGNGTTDDTAAIQAAINAVQTAGGGTLFFPPATYAVTPVSSTSAALVLNNGTAGYQRIRLVGSAEDGATIKRLANGPIITMSGPSTDTTGATHCRYCSIENLTLNGNSLTGALIQAYYADDLLFQNVHFENSADTTFDCAEFWDSRFFNCLWDVCGSTTANTTAPQMWLRNSAATSGFGFSSGSTNNIYFTGCRWEQYKSGAIRIERGLGTNTAQPYSLYFVNSKMETANVNGGGPTFFCDTTARDVQVINCHAYQGGFFGAYSTAQDVFTFGPQFGTLRNILIFNASAAACIASGVTLNAPLANSYVEVDNIRGSYTGGATPTGAHINFGTNTGGFTVVNCQSDNGTQFTGNVPSSATDSLITGASATGLVSITNATAVSGSAQADFLLAEATGASLAFGLKAIADTNTRFTSDASGNMSWGPGNAGTDTTLGRNASGVLQTGQSFRASASLIAVQNVRAGASASLGSGLVGGIELANVTTSPTGNPTGGGVSYAVNGVPWYRESSGTISTMVSPPENSFPPTGSLGETIARVEINSATQAIGATTGTVYMVGLWLPGGLKITNINWISGTTAAGTPTHWWLGLANSSGLQLAHTADQTTGAIAANTLITKALTGTFTTTYTGLHYILLSVTATTNPTATGLVAPTNANLTSPLLAGVSPSAAQSTPGTDGTTTYTVPSTAGGILYMYLT